MKLIRFSSLNPTLPNASDQICPIMEIEDLHFLLTPQGQQLLQETGDPGISDHNHLQVASALRQRVAPRRAQAIIETVLLRQRAEAKFSRAVEMFFTRSALEQASAEIVATYRADRYAQAGLRKVTDLGCGIGGDALALSAQAQVIGIDLDPLRLAMARENVRVYGNANHFLALQADLSTVMAPEVQAFFFDPARRDERGKRYKSVATYQPPLATVEHWRDVVAHGAVKVSPAIDYDELPDEAEVEFISVCGAVKEGVLWYGDLRDGRGRRATVLPAGASLRATDYMGEDIPVNEPATYLYEPDGAVIRAHLVQSLGRLLGCAQIDPRIAYLTSDACQATPFARCFQLEAWFPFQLKRLRSYLQAHDVGEVTIKKRGSPLDPDQLRQRLRLKGSEERILFLTHVRGQPAMLIGQEITGAVTQPAP